MSGLVSALGVFAVLLGVCEGQDTNGLDGAVHSTIVLSYSSILYNAGKRLLTMYLH